MERELSESHARELALREALEELRDWQNGPPLLSEKWLSGWNGAMAKADAALNSPPPPAVPREDVERFMEAFENWRAINEVEKGFDAEECIRRSSIMLQEHATYREKHPLP